MPSERSDKNNFELCWNQGLIGISWEFTVSEQRWKSE